MGVQASLAAKSARCVRACFLLIASLWQSASAQGIAPTDKAFHIAFQGPGVDDVVVWICPWIADLQESEVRHFLSCFPHWTVADTGKLVVAKEVGSAHFTSGFQAAEARIRDFAKGIRDHAGKSSMPRFLYLERNPRAGMVLSTLGISDERAWEWRGQHFDLVSGIAPIAGMPRDAVRFPGQPLSMLVASRSDAKGAEIKLRADVGRLRHKMRLQLAENKVSSMEEQIRKLGERMASWRVVSKDAIDQEVEAAALEAGREAAFEGQNVERAKKQAREGAILRARQRSELLEANKAKLTGKIQRKEFLTETGSASKAKEWLDIKTLSVFLGAGDFLSALKMADWNEFRDLAIDQGFAMRELDEKRAAVKALKSQASP